MRRVNVRFGFAVSRCVSRSFAMIFGYGLYIIAASAILRFGMPCRYVKDCRVGRINAPSSQ